jgi:hypothetical protein
VVIPERERVLDIAVDEGAAHDKDVLIGDVIEGSGEDRRGEAEAGQPQNGKHARQISHG